MSQVSDAIRQHHRELSHRLAEHVTALAESRPTADPEGLVAFLKGDLLPHAAGEEQHLYPAVEPLIKAHGEATATMRVDHEFIAEFIHQLEETTRSLRTAGAAERPALENRLQRLALQLEAIFTLHLAKEERVYLPLFAGHLSAEEQHAVLHGMHDAHQAEPATHSATTLDVRQVPPAQRHPLIFQTFDALRPGESFVLVNDHDPKPLFYQFAFERKDQFAWDYLEQGPAAWRVKISRTAAAKTR